MSVSAQTEEYFLVEECRVYKVDRERIEDPVLEMLNNYSLFCKGKKLTFKGEIGSGSYGFVYNIEIDDIEYALKVQMIRKIQNFKELAAEVSLSNMVKEYRRKDGQRIAVPVFDCFYLCNKLVRGACEGIMVYIMEKGEDSIEGLISTKPSDRYGDVAIKSMLCREAIIKNMENIHVMVTEASLINIDVKPGNSVYNFKPYGEGGKVLINPILIDFGPNFCFTNPFEVINMEKLNAILRNYKVDGKPVLNKNLDIEDCRLIISFILQLQYALKALLLLDSKELDRERRMEVISSVFFRPQIEGELICIRKFLEILVRPSKRQLWLSVSTRVILNSDYVDAKHTFSFKRNFFYYILSKRMPNVREDYQTMCLQMTKFYNKAMEYMGDPTRSNLQLANLIELRRLSRQPPPNRIEGREQKTYKAMGYAPRRNPDEGSVNSLNSILDEFENISSNVSNEEPSKSKTEVMSMKLKKKLGF